MRKILSCSFLAPQPHGGSAGRARTGEALAARLEEGLRAMGIAVWAMVDLEADDALASVAEIASHDRRVEKICIWTPDKDLSQCVRGDRVVQVDRKSKVIRDAAGHRLRPAHVRCAPKATAGRRRIPTRRANCVAAPPRVV